MLVMQPSGNYNRMSVWYQLKKEHRGSMLIGFYFLSTLVKPFNVYIALKLVFRAI